MSVRAAKRTADRWMSRWARLRDTDYDGLCHCYTCGRIDLPQNMHAGHYIGRQHLATRYEPKNVHAQCVDCNRWNEGLKGVYAARMDKQFGVGTADSLLAIGRARGKYPELWFRDIAKKFRLKTIELSNQNGCKWW